MMSSLVPPLAVRKRVYRCPLAWYAARDYALDKRVLGIDDLARHPIITFSRGTLPHAELEHKLPMTRLPAPLLHACASLSTTLHLTRAGFGIGLLPEPMAANDMGEGTLRRISVSKEAAMSGSHLRLRAPARSTRHRHGGPAACGAGGHRGDG